MSVLHTCTVREWHGERLLRIGVWCSGGERGVRECIWWVCQSPSSGCVGTWRFVRFDCLSLRVCVRDRVVSPESSRRLPLRIMRFAPAASAVASRSRAPRPAPGVLASRVDFHAHARELPSASLPRAAFMRFTGHRVTDIAHRATDGHRHTRTPTPWSWTHANRLTSYVTLLARLGPGSCAVRPSANVTANARTSHTPDVTSRLYHAHSHRLPPTPSSTYPALQPRYTHHTCPRHDTHDDMSAVKVLYFTRNLLHRTSSMRINCIAAQHASHSPERSCVLRHAGSAARALQRRPST